MTNKKQSKKKNSPNLNDKVCIECFIALTRDNTRSTDIVQSNYICIRCRKLRDKQRYQDRKEIIREQQRQYGLSNKTKIINAYGGKCNCCDESIYEFLTVHSSDNKNGSGNKLYTWIIKNNFPKEYEILCYNCHEATKSLGCCPHNKSDQILAGINALNASVLDTSISESAVE